MLCAVLTHLQIKTSSFDKEGYPDNGHSVGFFSRGYEVLLPWNQENDVFIRTAPGMAPERLIKMESMGRPK